VGGNLVTPRPSATSRPCCSPLDAESSLRSVRGERTLPLDEFFVGYRQTRLFPAEIIRAVRVPKLPAEGVRASAYKVSKRQELDISTTSAAFYVRTSAEGVVEEVRLAYGGMAATPARARAAEAALLGHPWTHEGVERAVRAAGPTTSAPSTITAARPGTGAPWPPTCSAASSSRPPTCPTRATRTAPRAPWGAARPGGLAMTELPPTPLYQPALHESGLRHTTGQARYVDDLPAPLVAHVLTSPLPRGRIVRAT
jgi:hypothetical protein